MSSGTDIVTQALALFAERYTQARNTSAAFEGRAVPLGSPAELISTPDVCLQIGRNDLGLPLVAAIRRSRPFDHHLNALASELERSGIIPPAALIDSFKKSLVDLRQQSWSRYCIREVLRTDGISEAMYVSNANLTGLLRPFLPRLLPDPTATMSAVQSPGTGRATRGTAGGSRG